jgi:N-methylhydantoinase A/oxoprolinase/acetone carboxylase beta subunit
VSVSTTLATNAVVEGHGSPVGVVLVGFDAQMVERTGIARRSPACRWR